MGIKLTMVHLVQVGWPSPHEGREILVVYVEKYNNVQLYKSVGFISSSRQAQKRVKNSNLKKTHPVSSLFHHY